MPESILPTAIAGADSAAAWFNRSLSQVLGLQPSATALRSDSLTLLTSEQERRAIATALGRRFLRKVDEATGAVTFEVVGTALVYAADEAEDPVLADIARTYLPGAKLALHSIDAELCRPGVCADQIEGLVWQATLTVDWLIAETPRRSGLLQIFLYLDQLWADERGLLSKIRKLIQEPPDGEQSRTVWHERSLQSLKTATRAIECFREALCEALEADDEFGMSRFWEVVERCTPHVAVHAATVRTAFAELGIGDCELERCEIEVPKDAVAIFCDCDVRAINLGGLLDALEAEPQHWVELRRYGAADQRASVVDSAIVLMVALQGISGDEVVKGFKLLEPQSTELKTRIERMCAYGISVFEAIIGGRRRDVGTKGGAPRGRGKRGDPTAD